MFLDKKMYLDDLRTPIEKFDFIARSYEEAIGLLKKMVLLILYHLTMIWVLILMVNF